MAHRGLPPLTEARGLCHRMQREIEKIIYRTVKRDRCALIANRCRSRDCTGFNEGLEMIRLRFSFFAMREREKERGKERMHVWLKFCANRMHHFYTIE